MTSKRVLSHAVMAFACVLSAACSESSEPNEPQATLTVVHASAALGNIDVLVDGETMLTGVLPGTSPAALVPSGSRRITVRSGATVVSEIDATLTTEHINAVIVANGTAQMSSSVIPDTGAVAGDRANLRLVNVVGTNLSDPTQLQVLINFPGVSADSTARIGMDSKIASYSSLLYFDSGHFRLRYVPAGTTNVLAETEFDIAQGEAKVAILQRGVNGQYSVQVVTEQCPTC